MKKNDVTIGQTYVVKVSGKLAPVRLVSESRYGGWNGVNVKTNRDIRIKSAAKLRRVYSPKSDRPRIAVSCDQCVMLSINGHACHETGCPNSSKTWIPERGWIKFVECRECSSDVELGEVCDCHEFVENNL